MTAPPPSPLGLPGSDGATITRLLSCAASVRTAADEIDRSLADLRAFDRPDVWRGARATAFRRELQDRFALLSSVDHGTSAQLRDAARRIEGRAETVRVEAEQAVIDDLLAGSPVEPFWLRR